MRHLLVFLLPVTCALLWPANSLAEGSCTWNDVTPILDSQPGLRRFLEESFQISPGGSARRLGKEFEALDGRRVGPYRFDVTGRTDPKLTMELVIDTRAEFINEEGVVLPKESGAAGVDVRERFASIRLEAVQSAPNSAAALPEPEIAERIAWSQARCNQLHLADHQIRTLDMPAGGKLTGKAIYHHEPLSGRLDYFTVDATGTNGAVISEAFYFNEGDLFFVLRRSPSIVSGEAGSELRYYLRNGEVIRATRTPIPPQGTAASAPVEEPLSPSPDDVNRMLVRVSRLALNDDPAQVAEDYAVQLKLAP